MSGLRAITVSVDYADELRLFLSCRRLFDEVVVVTAPGDPAVEIAREHDCLPFVTEAFWEHGAAFAKWRALERGLDVLGRRGWLAVVDCDVAWPQSLAVEPQGAGLLFSHPAGTIHLERGDLMTPLRHMRPGIPASVPPEEEWGRWPLAGNQGEWAGYSHTFHADSPWLGPPPWYDDRLVSAGTGDSLFQSRCPAGRKVRPPWKAIHFGTPGANWWGRSTSRADGSVPPEAAERRAALRRMIARRRNQPPGDRFAHERLPEA
jgi:hypothetical protein